MKTITILKCAVLITAISSCAKLNDHIEGTQSMVEISANALLGTNTKTTINGIHLSWTDGDKIGLYVSDSLQSNMLFRYSGGNSFSGSICRTGRSSHAVTYYAYYPYSECSDLGGTTITARLPSEQTAPFCPEADFMVSKLINKPYNESSMPELNFVFNSHLFSILKITVTNSNANYANDRLMGIDVISGSSFLSGCFSFDICNPAPSLSFSQGADSVSVNYSSDESKCPVLGHNVSHVIYAVVNNISNDNISIRVRTSRRTGYVYSSRGITTLPGELTTLATIDVNALRDVKVIKRLVYFGDSCASSNIIHWLQQLLGDDWIVTGGGIRGAKALSIVTRQGGLPLYFKNNVTIPGDHNQSVSIGRFRTTCLDTLYAPVGSYDVSSEYWVNVNNDPFCNPASPLVNDFEVCGELCRMTEYNGGQIYVSRVFDGNPIVVTQNTPIITYAAREFRDADVIVTYMGINGRNDISDVQLANCYQAMTDFSINKKHIVVGFHFDIIDGREYRYWTPAYRDYFTGRFGNNYLDLRTVGSANASRLCVETGQHTSASEMSELDRQHVALGEWPVSWTGSYRGDIHPTVWGHRAIAIMVYEKMRDLRYLNE